MTETEDHTADQALHNDLKDVYGQYEELRSGVDELQRSLATMEVHAESPDGVVHATVNSDGELVGLRLDERACREWNVDTLAGLIVETVRRASAVKLRQVEQLVTTHLSPDETA
ncbi:Conserved DNA-binding protein YbaB [Actinoplanes regularis]|uniref:Conserved DNA-binding protein YbaB n=1 Tax=Actinoplanes regularis TaxID=52697 RepID=A0A239B315_9ACTN|nr:YbaB/EbfC family nucleoid-associated protein [Actinoplanes regularis]GIE87188.1 hypothetical protein Are01nite_36680 [Actinoplanes regularis]GLW29932.1 hypothetical protein Areg01_28720 [Actinoplanes regularis]SNS02190.1 Conserved DNA-binding protein YbaB [Actinoplanes regularis]